MAPCIYMHAGAPAAQRSTRLAAGATHCALAGCRPRSRCAYLCQRARHGARAELARLRLCATLSLPFVPCCLVRGAQPAWMYTDSVPLPRFMQNAHPQTLAHCNGRLLLSPKAGQVSRPGTPFHTREPCITPLAFANMSSHTTMTRDELGAAQEGPKKGPRRAAPSSSRVIVV
jgi:hypothetical protein